MKKHKHRRKIKRQRKAKQLPRRERVLTARLIRVRRRIVVARKQRREVVADLRTQLRAERARFRALKKSVKKFLRLLWNPCNVSRS